MKRKTIYILLTFSVLLMSFLTSCSTRKNTAATRFWHSFTSRYNIYFNGYQAFLDGQETKLTGHRDNYTELLPVFLVGKETSRTVGSGSYETAITKCQKAITLHSIKRKPEIKAGKRKSAKAKQYLKRKEYNPFLKNAWMLMGISQFQKGEFFEAASTFSYITRLYAAEPLVASEARQWLARCYTQVEWYYDAEEALAKVRRDTVNPKTLREADATQADLFIRQERFAEAVPYLERAARHAKGSFRQARLYYLLGQINHHLDHKEAAYKALSRCIKKSPPFELALNARILQTEVVADNPKTGKKMISRLRKMAKSSNNKNYLDQVYYAMGNIYLTAKDTAKAIGAYEKGREKSDRNGIEKGVLLLRLGSIYWDQRKFEKAQECYTQALGMVDKTHRDFEEATRRSKVLDQLVPFTSSIALQDSLQALARMSEADRNAAIDRVIEALKKKEEEERKAQRDSLAESQMNGGDTGGNNMNGNNNNRPDRNTGQKNQDWYFYNAMLVMQGKQDFQKHWGKRKNEDNWRRSNRTVVAVQEDTEYDYEAEDSLKAIEDSLANVALTDTAQTADTAATDSLENDPHQRAYYLKQIPFSPEAQAESDSIIKEGLFNAGVIEKDALEDFPLAAETLGRLTTQYTEFSQMAEAYYQLFLLYSRWGKPDKAEQMRSYLAANFPQHELTRLMTAPDFEQNARYGKQIEDSLYTETYRAYRERDWAKVEENFKRSTEKYPSGLNRPKFILVHALNRLGTASTQELITELRGLLKDYPESDVSTMAGMIVKGLESGRQLGTGTFDLGSLWDRRSADADSTAAEAARQKQFSTERNAPFLFVLAYPSDSLDANKLLYEMAHFNFTSFVVRGFDMTLHQEGGLSQMRIAGFGSYDEAHAYAQRIYQSKELLPFLKKGRILLISQTNLEMLGSIFSFNDYEKFFDRTFAPIKLDPNLPIEQTVPVDQIYEDELSPEELEKINQKTDEESYDEDDGEWY